MDCAKARRRQSVSTAAQAESAWSVLCGGTRGQPGELHVTEICFSEALQQPQDQLPATLFGVFCAPSVMSSLCALDLSFNSLNDAFWDREWGALPPTGEWTALTSINLANNMSVGGCDGCCCAMPQY